jgi:UDP-N-acetylmuramoyl-L-alanyl-D-glutamate--2,6-diaminopimelate ligase
MALATLVDNALIIPPEAASLPILGLTADSREVRQGYLFAALPGTATDGTRFIGDAAQRGALAVLAAETAQHLVRTQNLAFVCDANPRRRLALAAATFFQTQPETVAAVTGTNGKTSIAYFLRQIWTICGKRAASLGTIGVVLPDRVVPLSHTTPDPVQLHRLLKEMKDEKIDHLAIEASSHGLAQYRLDGLHLRAAGFSNITRDHLDYHDSAEAYLEAKLRLFRELLPQDGIAVVNADGAGVHEVVAACRERKLACFTVGAAGENITLVSRAPRMGGQKLICRQDGRPYEINLPLAGAFQASNALVAAGLAIACGETPHSVFGALEQLRGAVGRLQEVARSARNAPIYVDYAHTPDALENVLTALRPHTVKSLNVIFGCGGDRDRGKRRLMGEVAARLADRIIVTDDNPRNEDPALIRNEILQGCPSAVEIADREAAISRGIDMLAEGDILVIAGKGHEIGQIVKDKVIPFSDIETARRIAVSLGGRS